MLPDLGYIGIPYRAKFYTSPPPTPESILLGVGRAYKRGASASNTPAVEAFKISTPHPPPFLQIALCPEMGGGGLGI